MGNRGDSVKLNIDCTSLVEWAKRARDAVDRAVRKVLGKEAEGLSCKRQVAVDGGLTRDTWNAGTMMAFGRSWWNDTGNCSTVPSGCDSVRPVDHGLLPSQDVEELAKGFGMMFSRELIEDDILSQSGYSFLKEECAKAFSGGDGVIKHRLLFVLESRLVQIWYEIETELAVQLREGDRVILYGDGPFIASSVEFQFPEQIVVATFSERQREVSAEGIADIHEDFIGRGWKIWSVEAYCGGELFLAELKAKYGIKP
jgi:hypothetical protein